MNNKWSISDMPDQSGRVVLITGANSGLGLASAIEFARRNAHVIMACRNPEKAQEAVKYLLNLVPNASVDVLALDLGDLKSIRAFAEIVNERYEKLDILMNNAGVMIPPYGKTKDGFETQFGTNYLGHFALTGLLLPKIIKTPASRIITLSSSSYYLNNGKINFDDLQSEKKYGKWSAYAQSKLAILLFMRVLQLKLDDMNAETISVASDPGAAMTNLQKMNKGVSRGEAKGDSITLSGSAQSHAIYQLYAATAPDVQGGEYFQPRWILWGRVKLGKLNKRARNMDNAVRLWKIAEELTNVHY
ncbi:hypothetical protein BZG01_20570 [Labilibaculum manganireducens]|uniref:Short-chain dehydrogenase n=1 Tax=Labilibaculum manganireducens TaxID=1940525 RepID=A0A2N3HRR1_9BACT|nr:oxidoreductase [Labilibaculum manganireducens]PKQ60733.1 hypothetical protein BZG01_20570 [Labilibaculum manganireducens]